jgi:hypothetical protein
MYSLPFSGSSTFYDLTPYLDLKVEEEIRARDSVLSSFLKQPGGVRRNGISDAIASRSFYEFRNV